MVTDCKKCGENSPGIKMYNHKTKKMGKTCKRCIDVRFFILIRLAEFDLDFEKMEEEVNGNV